jgi:hypothetical protein
MSEEAQVLDYIPTNQADEMPIKDDIAPQMVQVRQTYGEAKAKYYVMMVGGGVPTRPHSSRFWAEKEAQRLAAVHPDKVFHVLKVKSTFEARSRELAEIEARANLKLGQRVRVNKSHFRNAGETGEVTGFTPIGSVTVLLESGESWAFAPTSLKPLDPATVGTMVSAEGVGG